MNFQEFCNITESIDDQIVNIENSVVIKFKKDNGSEFSISPNDIVLFLKACKQNHASVVSTIVNHPEFRKENFTQYQEETYRALYKAEFINLKSIASLGGSQTQQITRLISRFICFLSNQPYIGEKNNTYFDLNSISKALEKIPENIESILVFDQQERASINKKLAFQSWLKKKGKSEKTIHEYSENVIIFANKILRNSGIKVPLLLEEQSTQEVKNIISAINSESEWIEKNKNGNGMYRAGINNYLEFAEFFYDQLRLSKSFLILAGISGTGKSRYVKNQASVHNTKDCSNYRLIPVRPDWHEPSDLMGYVSGINTPRYIATEFLIFIVAAWKNAFASADKSGISLKPVDQITPFWLCLDEMNLAPVEQYFADYLAVIETCKWSGNNYECAPLLKAEIFSKNASIAAQLRNDLELNDAVFNGLWEYFSTIGIPLPPNLIVAGTVNMDETTHGFSRKVIDRAFSIDFGAFFPNDFSLYFGGQPLNKKLSFPVLTSVSKEDLQDIKADPDGARSIAFISRINDILANTPFELAYRALNELLLSVVCFKPETDIQLQAVWDDFLMTKVLPRIEGDAQKLQVTGQSSLLSRLTEQAKNLLIDIWNTERPDLLRNAGDGGELLIPCRSKQKLSWMEKRLSENEFTSFWP